MRLCFGFAAVVVLLFCFEPALQAEEKVDLTHSQMPSVITVPPEALPSDHFDPEAATNAYLAQIPASARARSDAYFEGGYWLILWDFLMSAAIYLALLIFGWSAKMRDWARRLTRFAFLQDLIYWLQFMIIAFVLGAPLAIYEGYFREHKYGLATQTFGPWMVDQLKALLVGMILGGIAVVVLFKIVRKLPNTWHIWGAIVSVCLAAFFVMIVPVFIVPVFNKVTRLNDPKITAPILSLARANGIPAQDVFQVDASKQSTRMSANVSGLARTTRITLNDNLLRRGSPEEIQSVMGHEMGHYVLHHIFKDIIYLSIVIVVFFAILRRSLDWSLSRWGEAWGIHGISDVAVLPLVLLVASTCGFLYTPIDNTQTRINEHEADMYGLNASRQPDGFAQAAIHLGEYRKMDPGPVEEFIFYDHPSGRRRIFDAMQWKKENLQLFQDQRKP